MAIQTLVPSDETAPPRALNTRAQNERPNSEGILFGKYQRSANAHSPRLTSGPKIANASRPSTSPTPSVPANPCGRQRAVVAVTIPPARPHAADRTTLQ